MQETFIRSAWKPMRDRIFPTVKQAIVPQGLSCRGSSWSSLTEGSRRNARQMYLWDLEEEAYQLYMDVSTLFKLLKVLEESSLRAAEAAEVLKEFTRIVGF